MNSLVVVSGEQYSCDLHGEVAILNMKNGVYYGLNTVGSKVWYFIHEPKPAHEIRDYIMRLYDVPQDSCESDLIGLLQEMARENLIMIL